MVSSNNRNNFGVVYVATGKRYMESAVTSATSMREHHENPTICVFTDAETQQEIKKSLDIFDEIKTIPDPEHNWNDKIYAIQNTPYQETLYIDSDTIIIKPFLEDIKEGLDYYPILVRGKMGFNFDWESSEYPASIPQFNTGVIAYDMSPKVEDFLATWKELRKKRPEGHDQPTFREALLQTQLPYADIHTSYNYFSGGNQVLLNEVRVVHDVQGLIDDPENSKIIENVSAFNGESSNVVLGRFVSKNGEIQILGLIKLAYHRFYPERVVNSIRHYGVVETIKKGVNKL